MSVTIIAVLFSVLIIAFFGFMLWALDKRNEEIETARQIKLAERREMRLAELQALPTYKLKLSKEQLAKLEAELA